jgi:ABC-type multidrug transport system fused ATPase/permease subunit
MGLPPNAVRHFAEKHLDAAYKHLSGVQETLFKESQEDRRAFEKFYNNLALFSGGTIALSITYLGYLKTLSKPLAHQWLLRVGWVALFCCLLFSLVYVLVNLYYGHHFRERELADAQKKKFDAEAEEFPKMELENLREPATVAAFARKRREAVQECASRVERHQKLQDRYMTVWQWSGRLALIGFASGIGMLLVFAVLNM